MHTLKKNYANKTKLNMYREKAKEAEIMHYAPYSNFKVLAVIETVDGKLFAGSNVENVNYSLTVHAEQNAIMNALANGALENGREFINAIYITCPADTAPCGSCRQSLNEFITKDAIWISENSETNETFYAPFQDLLPFDFGPRHLEN